MRNVEAFQKLSIWNSPHFVLN